MLCRYPCQTRWGNVFNIDTFFLCLLQSCALACDQPRLRLSVFEEQKTLELVHNRLFHWVSRWEHWAVEDFRISTVWLCFLLAAKCAHTNPPLPSRFAFRCHSDAGSWWKGCHQRRKRWVVEATSSLSCVSQRASHHTSTEGTYQVSPTQLRQCFKNKRIVYCRFALSWAFCLFFCFQFWKKRKENKTSQMLGLLNVLAGFQLFWIVLFDCSKCEVSNFEIMHMKAQACLMFLIKCFQRTELRWVFNLNFHSFYLIVKHSKILQCSI